MISKAAKMAAAWWAERLESGDKGKFTAFLEGAIQKALDQDGEVDLRTDDDPDGILLEAVQAAGLECSGCMFSCRGILPMKTLLVVTPTRLYPKEGYGNWVAEIAVEG